MEPNLDLIGHAAPRQINVMLARGIVTLMTIVQLVLYVEQTIVKNLVYQEAVGIIVQIVALVSLVHNNYAHFARKKTPHISI